MGKNNSHIIKENTNNSSDEIYQIGDNKYRKAYETEKQEEKNDENVYVREQMPITTQIDTQECMSYTEIELEADERHHICDNIQRQEY